ncbi:MAG TPA: PKD domain-containing protein [Polyangia bacterium]|nr:PKD domain-containing protein [Polyangia bacterium]
MVGRRPPSGIAVGAALCIAALGCNQRAYMAPRTDAGPGADGAVMGPLTLDISVTGCATFDVTTVVCSGPAPLTVSFAPVGSSALTSFLWTFGDGTPSSSERAPSHTYALPKSYDVKVTGAGTVGTVSQVRHGLISVLPLSAGAACDVDSQCSDGLRCACKLGSGCGPAFSRGLCSTSCATGFCGAGAVCAAIALGAPFAAGDGGSPAPADAGVTPPVCLASCGGGAACAAGLVCQQLPGGAASALPWVAGCLPIGAAKDFGASCRNADGALEDAACTTGLCADIGALGVCSAACTGGETCPSGAACATLPGQPTPLCLPACSPANPCTGDPSLQCTVATDADAGIDGGLTISAGIVGVAYCAPK